MLAVLGVMGAVLALDRAGYAAWGYLDVLLVLGVVSFSGAGVALVTREGP